ncbi:carbon-nitrogen hydrolase family protein [Amycolatopsis sp. NPDC059021]|uniref:carbon-nitrogen hydrolase family protein n=1 Tax=Amycolatopsis sp. NPDC059021 TaxID=3346704 RepID=UPI00366F6DF2
MVVVAALQLGASPEGTAATLERLLGFEEAIRAAGAAVVVLPEAILGGYPEAGLTGDAFARYFGQAVEIPGPETDALAGLAARTGASLVAGVIERSGSTLYCTAVFLDPVRGLTATHRKLAATGRERLVWGRGDGSTLPVVPTAAGPAGVAICWENLMPLLRAAMYAKGVQLWCAPTVDDSDAWLASLRHIACEGRCFVISACQYGTCEEFAGGSAIVGPLGDVLAGPLRDSEGLVTAEIDPAEVVAARRDLDVSGHYARPDIFTLTVDQTPRPGVAYRTDV